MPGSKTQNRQHSAKVHLSFGWRSLTPQLFLVVVLPLAVLLLAITFTSLALHQQAMRKLVAERDLASVQTASAAIRQQANLRMDGLQLLADLSASAPTVELDKLLRQSQVLNRQFEYGVAFLNPSGKVEAASGDPELWSAIALAASSQDNSAFGDSYYLTMDHPTTGEPLVVALVVSADRRRVTAGALSPSVLARPVLNEEIRSNHGPSFLLISQDRRVLFRSGNLFQESESPDHPGIVESLNGLSGTTYLRAKNSEHVVAYSPVGDLGWGLVGEEPWEMVDTPWLRNTQVAPLVLAPVLVLTLLGLWFAARQIVRPLQELESQSALLATGDFAAIEAPVGGIMEVRHLQSALIQMAHELRAAQQSLHGFIGAITTAQEDERKRLARDLHDETIQSLIALKQQIQLARMDLTNCGNLEPLEGIGVMAEQAIEELRRVIRALRPIYLEDLGLVAALDMLARETAQLAGISVGFYLQGTEQRLDPAIELTLYRIAQEALNNVVRHARAQQASLSIHFALDQITMEIVDDGAGFTAPKSRSEITPNGHYGLLGLFERAELIGAVLQLDSAPATGTRIRVTVSSLGSLGTA